MIISLSQIGIDQLYYVKGDPFLWFFHAYLAVLKINVQKKEASLHHWHVIAWTATDIPITWEMTF